ncbi:MAG TPA: hypothetical protein VK879_07285 [Candidatus Sulfomarinibacteraceae bacterium]|nr:hypothetical protein [Candidatus Sulfomarinibacteraceae bacterium]
MRRPRDHHIVDRVGAVRAARLFSNVVSPPVMFAVLGLLLAWIELPPLPALGWAAVYGFFVSLAPILLVLYLLRTGRVAELHMSNTTERHVPYLAAGLSSGFVLALLSLFDGPEVLRCLTAFNIVTLVLLGIINTRWLISFHAAAASALLIVVALVFGLGLGLALLPLLLAVIAIRLYLRRHTVAEIVGGIVVGGGSVVLLTPFGCFV